MLLSFQQLTGRVRSSGAAGSAAVLRQIIPSRIWRTASYHWARRSPLTPFNGPFWPVDFGKLAVKDLRIPAHQLVRLFQWAILTHWFRYGWNQVPGGGTWFSANLEVLQVESGCHLGNLIFNDLESLRVESSGHFDHLIFTEWEWRVTGGTEVIKMITPVTLLRMRSSYHFDNLILIRLKSSSQSGNLIWESCKSSYGKRNLISDDSPNSHFGDLGVSD